MLEPNLKECNPTNDISDVWFCCRLLDWIILQFKSSCYNICNMASKAGR